MAMTSPAFQGNLTQQQHAQQRANTPEFKALQAQQDAGNEQLNAYMRQSPLYQQQTDLMGKMDAYMKEGQPQEDTMLGMSRPMVLPRQTPFLSDIQGMQQQALQQAQDIQRTGGMQPEGLKPPTQLPPILAGGTPMLPTVRGGIGGIGGGGGSGGQTNVSLNLQGSATMNPQGGSQNKGYNGWSFAEGGSVPQGLASLGRGQDSMLVHMTPGEVGGLQQLAMAHGGSLTINPHTGLPEAGILSALLPMAAGFALGPAGFGLMSSSLGAAAVVGGLGALATGSLGKGLKYGLSAYSGSELGGGLKGMGLEQAQGLQTAETNAAADLAGKQAYDKTLSTAAADQAKAIAESADVSTTTFNPPKLTNSAYDQYGAPWGDKTPTQYMEPGFAGPITPTPAPTFLQNPTEMAEAARRQAIDETGFNYKPEVDGAAGKALARGPVGNMFEGVKQLGTKEGLKTLGGKLGYAGVAGLAAPLVSNMLQQQPKLSNLPKQNIPRPTYDYRQGTVNPAFGQIGQPYFLDEGFTRTGAEGGLFYNTENKTYPQAQLSLQHMAGGVVEDAQEYAAGGRLLRGPGDGMSDSIPAVIKGARPQRAALADGEFVIPADVVSHLGNGSTEAGAKRLYSMMDKVRHARTGNKKQGRQISPERLMPA